jgi:hypothetical protein
MKKKIFFIDGLINISAAQTFLFLQKIISDKKVWAADMLINPSIKKIFFFI